MFLTLLARLISLFLAVAFCTLPVLRGASVCTGLPAERPGLPSHAATLPEHSTTSEPHVSHNQCLLSGKLMKETHESFATNTSYRAVTASLCDDLATFWVSLGIAQCLVLVHCVSHSGYVSDRGNHPHSVATVQQISFCFIHLV